MPFTEPTETVTEVWCICGNRVKTLPQHYLHVVNDCQMLRCVHCWSVLGTGPFFDTVEDHTCHGGRVDG